MKTRQTRVATAVATALCGYCLVAGADEAAAPLGPAPTPAAAAAASPAGESPELETVIVTGLRASYERSLERKRASESVVEVVTADDIGKLPDKNVADAVQRLPGVNISSGSGGEGGFSENDRVSLRGTNPSLTQTTLNGHAIATGDWYIGDQTQTVGRSVSFTLLPAEIVGAVEVQKSSQADYIEGGTVGNVDIETRRPLGFKKPFTVQLTGQVLYADLPDTKDPQFNGLVNWMNPDKTFGVLLQGFSEARHERRDGQELFLLGEGQIGSPDPASPNFDPVAQAHPDLAGVAYPTQIGSAAFTQHSKRTGGLVDLQWQATDRLMLDLNGFYSHFDATNFDTNFMASPLNELGATDINGNPAGIAPTSYTVVNGTLEAASFPATPYDPTNPYGSAFPGVRDSISRPKAASSTSFVDFDTRLQATDRLLLTAKVGYTRAIGETPNDEGYEAFLINAPLNYQMLGTVAPATVSFPGYDTTNFNDPVHVVNGGSWHSYTKVTDQETYAQADGLLTMDRGVLQSLKVGLRYAKHERDDYGINYNCSADPNAPCTGDPSALPKPNWNNTVSPGNFGSGIGMHPPDYLQHFWVMNPTDIAAWMAQYFSVSTGPNYQGNFTITEKDAAGYLMANLAGSHWRGNAGVRVVHTDQLSDAFNIDPISGAPLPVSSKHDFWDVLPSINLRYDLTPELVGRFAASRTMSRADYSALSPAVSLNNLDLTGTGGNADLKPVRSNNFDVALEWYFARASLLSIGLFYMDMPSYVTYGYNTRTFINTSTNQLADFVVTSPFNISARNYGAEVAWQQPLWGPFGALANYTYNNGHTADGQPLVGSSRNTANAELYYEAHGLSARIAYTYRSTFLVGLANVTQQYEAGIGTLAASLYYSFNDNFMITFDALNLNNPRLKYYSNAEQPQAFYSNGRQFFLGVRISL
jgi:iron complex outermembrane receptor protein